jgi:hypothetical protein
MNTPQATDFLYEWRHGDEGGQTPDEWVAQRILKRTKKFVFVERRISDTHPYRQTMRLDRAKLEAQGYIYWHSGTWVVSWYTEEGKKQYDLQRARWNYIPECLKVFGLTKDATADDVKRVYYERALKEHPDAGGSHEGFLKLQEQYQAALKMVKS